MSPTVPAADPLELCRLDLFTSSELVVEEEEAEQRGGISVSGFVSVSGGGGWFEDELG